MELTILPYCYLPLIGLIVGIVSHFDCVLYDRRSSKINGYLETMLARPELITLSYLFCGVDFQPM